MQSMCCEIKFGAAEAERRESLALVDSGPGPVVSGPNLTTKFDHLAQLNSTCRRM